MTTTRRTPITRAIILAERARRDDSSEGVSGVVTHAR
jgi:hypothetical protein